MTDGLAINEFKRGWKPLAASSIGIALGLSPLSPFTSGVFAVQLEHQFGWSRGAILGVQLMMVAALLVFGPVAGRLSDRFGARPVALWSTLGLGLGMASLSLVTRQIWTYYALYALMSVVAMGTMPVVYGKVVSLWFDRYRGLALGMALCTTGLTGIFLPVYSQALIDRFGWRWAYVGVGLLPLLIALPVLAAFLPRGGGPARAVEASGEAIVLDGLEIKAALSHYRYWLLAFTALAGGVGLGGVVFNLIPLLVDRGLRPAAAAKLFGSYGLSLIFGRLASGWLLDRFWAPAVGFAFMLLPVVAALTLAQGVHATALLLMATCLMGFAGGAEFDLVAYLTSRYFGRRNFGTLYAGEYAFFGLGSGTAPALYGAVHDATGSYNSVLLATAALFASGGIALLFLGRYPKFSGLQA